MSPFWSRNKAKIEQIGRVANAEQGDAMIIEQLRQLGADLTKPRIVHHYIYLPKSAEEAATKMVEQ